MIANTNLIFYTCIAKGPQILAQFTKEPGLEAVAHQCIEKTPEHHSMFSHTIRTRTYTFLIEDPFVYFAIFDESIKQSEGLWFLNSVKNAFEDLIESGSVKDLGSNCFQAQFDLIFREVMALDLDLVDSPRSTENASRNSSLDSLKGKKMVVPLLKKPSNINKGLKKKKRVYGEGNGDAKELEFDNKVKVDVGGDVVGRGLRDFSGSMQKSNLHLGDRQKAKQVWKKHVWVVLLLDLFVCVVLLGIWLWVCRGFNCIDG